MPNIIVEVSGAIGTITLNRPKVNALSHALIDEIISALDSMNELNQRVIILRAHRGAKVFSAGHDIGELPTNGRDPLTYNDPLSKLAARSGAAPARS